MKKLILFLVTAICLNSFGQQISVDASFDTGPIFSDAVYATALQTDGKIIVGGYFSSFNGTGRNYIARLNSDGTLDNSFDTGEGFDYAILSVALQPDGKIIVGGAFSFFNGIPINKLARLNSDGSLDLSFNIGSGIENNGFITSPLITSIAVQPNGKIIISGQFSTYNGLPRNNIARLNSDGSLDVSFDIGTGFNDSNSFGASIMTTAIQPDGKILVGGSFNSFNGIERNNIARLNLDGTLDISFDIGSGFDDFVSTTVIQSDGKVILGGSFNSFNGIGRNKIARLNSDGTLDLTFDVGSGFDNTIWTTVIQPDGNVIVGGGFITFNGITINRLARLSPSGTLDFSYDIGSGFDFDIRTTVIQPDGKIIVGGDFTSFNGSPCFRVTRLKKCGYTSSLPFSETICQGEIYAWNDQQYLISGQYQQNFINQFGCDSVATLNLTVLPNVFNPTFSSTQQLYTAPPFAVQFSNSTANSSNYTFTWDFGDGTTLASNNATVFHQYLYNGQYTVSLIATSNTTGCSDTTTLSDYIFCTGGVSCTHTATINQTSPQQACQGSPLWLTCNSDPSFSYQWRRNGVAIPGNNNDSLQVTQSGTYSVLISVNNCPVTSSDVVVNVFSAPTTPVITSSGAIQPCVGGSVTLNAGSYTTYNWSTGATTQSINVSSSGTFTVSVTSANGCSATSAPFIVNASFVESPQVCIVGMDSLTNENRIVWEKPITNGIDSFYVYKESNVSNVYTKIGATDYNDLAVYLDVNSNPAVQAYRYKISALDTCGVETNVGDFHKTIHLTINQGIGSAWNLIWSHYEGINFGSYNIYRGTDPSNISLLTTIQSNLNSYTDLTPPTGPLYYQIEVVNPVNCDPNKSINYGISRSNIVNNGLVGITDEVISSMQVYPNPTNDKLTLGVSNDLLGKQYFITDFSGRIIIQGKINMLNQIIELTNVSNGSYLLQVENSNAKAIKIVKQ